MTATIDDHINKDRDIINDPMMSAQYRRHIEEELKMLENYKETHPNDDHDPSPLELFCNENPEAPECRIYDN